MKNNSGIKKLIIIMLICAFVVFVIYYIADNSKDAISNTSEDKTAADPKGSILQMTATLENSTTELQFNYAENIDDERGITFGCVGFCTGTFDGNELIKHYTELNPDNTLKKYIPVLDQIDAAPHNGADGDGNPDTTGLDDFIKDVNNCDDPLFKQAQIDKVDELYYNPAVSIYKSIGGKYNLTLAFIYDMCVRHGENGAQEIIDNAASALGGTPKTGVDEKTFLSELIRLRDIELADEGLGDVDRTDGFKSVLSSGNVDLVTPFEFTAYGDKFTITGDLGINKLSEE